VEKRHVPASQLPTVPRSPDGDDRASAAAQGPLVLGRYRLHRRLGAGGFATVWLARDQRLDRDVAVKILPRERIVSGRFEREARAAARLAHPAIVTLYEAAVDQDGAYLVCELVQGATLHQLLAAGRLSDRDILMIGIVICDALVHAHGHGIVHRDVKPSNVLVPARAGVASGPVAKLTDFGVAHIIGGDSLTRTGDVIGTAAYMAPEQAEGRPVGAAADLYSLALVLYEALTGTNPVASDAAGQRARRLGAYLPPLRRQRRDLPRELGHGIDLALRPRARERGSLEELRDALSLSLEKVGDRPGVITGPWRRRTNDGADHELGGAIHEIGDAEQDIGRAAPELPVLGAPDVAGRPPATRVTPTPSASHRWPARALAAAGAATFSAWLVAQVLAPVALAPVAAALLGALLVVALPRTGWLALSLTAAGSLVLAHRPGGALVLLLGALLPVLLLPGYPAGWPLAAGAPVLGVIGVAGAWPALAARAGSAWRRAALAVTGWVWLLLAACMAGTDLYSRRPGGTPVPSAWMPSLSQATHRVLTPLLDAGVLAIAPVWAAGAVVLPWIIRGRSTPAAVLRVAVWAVALAVSTTVILASAGGHGLARGDLAALGAVVSALVALAPGFMRQWATRRVPPTPRRDCRSMETP